MELVLKRIAKRNGYTIGRLSLSPDPSPVGRGDGNHNNDTDIKASPTGGGLVGASASPMGGGMEGASYFCDTLEPTWRDYKHGAQKIMGISAIPEGRYAVVITWSPRMKQWLPLLLGVPMFSGIRIHAGNTAADTAGCILVGENLKKGMVLNSRIWLKRLKEKIVEAKARGEGVWITIT